MMAWRSLLFVPGDEPARIARAASRGADAIIVDLEDAVVPAAKPAARSALPDSIRTLCDAGADVVVRINQSWLDVFADLDAAVCEGVEAVMVPKSEDPARLAVLAEMVGEFERQRGLDPGRLGLIALIETPAGVVRAAEIAAIDRVVGLALGTEDLSLAFGAEPTEALLDLPCRQIALAAATRQLMAFAVPISIASYRDEDGCRIAAARAKGFASTGALCIHPAQVLIANAAFAPSEPEIARARKIARAWVLGDGDRRGVVVHEGKMIDRPVLARAQRTLTQASRAGDRTAV